MELKDTLRLEGGPPRRSIWGLTATRNTCMEEIRVKDIKRDKGGAEDGVTEPCRETARLRDTQCKQAMETKLVLDTTRLMGNNIRVMLVNSGFRGRVQHTGPVMKLQQRTPRRRGQQPKLLNSPEDSLYYNQLNRTLDYHGSKRKPRKLGQIKVLDGEDEYYKLLSTVESIPEEEYRSLTSVSAGKTDAADASTDTPKNIRRVRSAEACGASSSRAEELTCAGDALSWESHMRDGGTSRLGMAEGVTCSVPRSQMEGPAAIE
ncbi:Myosin-IIIb [Liparis tanakae]|uniref:Myosin-IIIb n=1 Tax=Liparis tanakae TaxID=230148 RepID=A0A4Z2GL38_9TELE|nr:Myosin-IIIb [Liparis tanakae]